MWYNVEAIVVKKITQKSSDFDKKRGGIAAKWVNTVANVPT